MIDLRYMSLNYHCCPCMGLCCWSTPESFLFVLCNWSYLWYWSPLQFSCYCHYQSNKNMPKYQKRAGQPKALVWAKQKQELIRVKKRRFLGKGSYWFSLIFLFVCKRTCEIALKGQQNKSQKYDSPGSISYYHILQKIVCNKHHSYIENGKAMHLISPCICKFWLEFWMVALYIKTRQYKHTWNNNSWSDSTHVQADNSLHKTNTVKFLC